MGEPKNELEKQVEAAFDYRGHATVRLESGEAIEGYVFNREFGIEGFLELFPIGSEERRRVALSEVAAVELTGKDHAESFEDGLKRTGFEKK